MSVNFPDSKPIVLFIRCGFVSWFCIGNFVNKVSDVFGSHHWSLVSGGGRSVYTTAEALSERTLFNSLEFR